MLISTITRRLFTVAAAAMIAGGLFGASAQAQDKLSAKIAVGARGVLLYLPLEVAKAKGFFDEQGVDVELVYFPGGPAAATALFSGSADFLAAGTGEIISAAKAGKSLSMLVTFFDNPSLVLGVSVKEGEGITTAADLKGRKIGVTQIGAGTHMLVNAIIAKAGLQKGDVEIVAVGSDTAPAALEAGAVVASMLGDPFATIVKESGKVRWLVDLSLDDAVKDSLGGVPFVWTGLSDQRAQTPEKQALTQKVVNALYKACKFISWASAEEVHALLPPEGMAKDKEIFMKSYEHSRPAFSKSCIPSEAAVNNYVNTELAAGFRTQEEISAINLDGVIEPKFAKAASEAK